MTRVLLCSLSIGFATMFSTTGVAQSWNITGNANASGSSKLGTTRYQPVRFYTNNVERMRIASSGNIGINTANPTARFHIKQIEANRAIKWEHESRADAWTVGIGVNTLNCRFEYNSLGKGQISTVDGSYTTISDLRLKEDIDALTPVLEKVMQLKPSSYYLKGTKSIAKTKSIGFISQEMEKFFPEMVVQGDDGFKFLNYSGLSVIAIKSVQEQQSLIIELRKQLDEQKVQMDELKEMVKTLGGNVNVKDVWIKQNTPNPVKSASIVQYFVSDEVRQARVLLTNAKGEQIRFWNLNKGSGTLNISSSNLAAGTYLYTLVADGKTIQTKKLVIVK